MSAHRGHTCAPPGPFVIWITSVHDRSEHAVTVEYAEATAGSGVYESLCETTFTPEALIAPPGPRCPDCRRRFQDWLEASRPSTPLPLWRRLLAAVLGRRPAPPARRGGK